jgi:NAD-dependent deacetylase
MFDIEAYLSDADLRVRAWRSRSEHPAWTATPNAGHLALVELERSGRMHALITQNIDELHQQAGNGFAAPVLEVHGSIRRAVCLSCEWRGDMREVLSRVAAGEDDPPCTNCGGILKSDTVSFGQSLDRGVLTAAARAATNADVMLVVGSSLQVHPVAGLVPLAHDSGAVVLIVNGQPTAYEGLAETVIRGPIEQVLPTLVAAD